eukprot:COSAG04_NODE_14428_length_568_cov_1.424307_1_plen_82_part_00
MPEGAEEGVLAAGLEVWQLRTLALGFVWGKAAGLGLSVSACNALELPVRLALLGWLIAVVAGQVGYAAWKGRAAQPREKKS